jgi:hypothetical protein
MATTATLENIRHTEGAAAKLAFAVLSFVACASLPIIAFGAINAAAESININALFFAPFDLSAETGATVHLAQLSLLGLAFWAVGRAGDNRREQAWILALLAAYIFLPFVTPALDSLQLSLLCATLFLLTLATSIHASAVSRLAGWLMAPTLGVLGFSATMGLAIAAAYTPPFALVQGQQPIAAA